MTDDDDDDDKQSQAVQRVGKVQPKAMAGMLTVRFPFPPQLSLTTQHNTTACGVMYVCMCLSLFPPHPTKPH